MQGCLRDRKADWPGARIRPRALRYPQTPRIFRAEAGVRLRRRRPSGNNPKLLIAGVKISCHTGRLRYPDEGNNYFDANVLDMFIAWPTTGSLWISRDVTTTTTW
jgi:hypothetical protein